MWALDTLNSNQKIFVDMSAVKPVSCLNPYVLRLPGSAFPSAVPCRKCILCLSQKSINWGNRIELESLAYSPEEVCFCTLTYSPEHLPTFTEAEFNDSLGIVDPSDEPIPTLRYSDVQLFLKRLRKMLSYKIRFFCCGEYGSVRGRPHYHLIIFGLRPFDHPLVSLAWSRGIVDVQVAGVKAFSYCAKYMTKINELPRNPLQFPPFFRFSKGLGRDFVKEVISSYRRKDLVELNCFGVNDIKPYMFLNGRKILIPSYCIKKFREHFLSLDERKTLKEVFLDMGVQSFQNLIDDWLDLATSRSHTKNSLRAYVGVRYQAYHFSKYINLLNLSKKLLQKGWYDGD